MKFTLLIMAGTEEIFVAALTFGDYDQRGGGRIVVLVLGLSCGICILRVHYYLPNKVLDTSTRSVDLTPTTLSTQSNMTHENIGDVDARSPESSPSLTHGPTDLKDQHWHQLTSRIYNVSTADKRDQNCLLNPHCATVILYKPWIRWYFHNSTGKMSH